MNADKMTARQAIAIAERRAFDFCGTHNDDSRAALAYCEKAIADVRWNGGWRQAFASAIEILSALR